MRSVPSPTALRRYLERFHDREEEERREPHRAFIPRPSEALRGLGRVNGDLLAFAQRHERQQEATLDMDATLIETGKRQALYSYQQTPAYQPLTTYWAEADVVLHSEFGDGNLPAGYEQLRVMQEAMQVLPPGVERVYMRSDTAGYQQELLRYCAEGRDPPSGLFGANAAWWAMVVLASNLNATFKRLLLPAEWGDIVKSCGSAVGADQAASLPSVTSSLASGLTGRSCNPPSTKTPPARTTATRCGAFTRRQRCCAASSNL